jgi:acid phosphatase family membrane protein YuiD
MYLIIILPLVSALLAQIIKMFLHGNHIKFSPKNLVAYSGMPSGHSALMISLATIIFLTQGLASPIFALTLVMAILVIRDAVGLRQYLGEHGKILNRLVKDLDDDRVLEEHYPHLLERIGHTPMQVLAGSLLGFAVSIVGYFLFK